MVGSTFSRRNGSSRQRWVNDGRHKKKEESKQCEREGADTHLSHSSKCTVAETSSCIDRRELYFKNFIPRRLKWSLKGLNDLSSLLRRSLNDWVTDRCCQVSQKAEYTHSTAGVKNRAQLRLKQPPARDIRRIIEFPKQTEEHIKDGGEAVPLWSATDQQNLLARRCAQTHTCHYWTDYLLHSSVAVMRATTNYTVECL